MSRRPAAAADATARPAAAFARRLAAALVGGCLLAAGPAAGQQPPAGGVTVAVTVVGQPRNERVVGELVKFDESTLTLQLRGGERVLRWNELTPNSAFTARYRLVDESDAESWLELARFGRALGLERQSEGAIKRALQLDASLAADVEAIRGLPLGSLRPAEPEPEAQPEPPAEAEAMPPGADVPPPVPHGPGAFPRGGAAPYEAVTPAQHAAAIEEARRFAENAGRLLGVRFREVQTPHFIIFTDWEPVDDPWLHEQLEMAYALVAREFNLPATDNVFVGKLPVFMYHSPQTMLRHARELDDFPAVTESVAGYYRGVSDGSGRLVMSKPLHTREMGPDLARQAWARTLTHEFAHAFIARYRSNAFVPRWLNEGIAEVIAEQVMARPGGLEQARAIARSGMSIADIFDDSVMPPAEMYPVMMTLADGLYRQSPERFRELLDAIKRGEPAENALRRLYDLDYAGLELAWRAHMIRQ